jgi:hypothetical protein
VNALAEERRRRGLSLEQVASATRIRVAHLAALEDGNLEALPGAVYARGYTRTYARYLGVDVPDEEPVASAERSLSIDGVAPRRMPRLVVTGPLLGGLGLALLSGLFLLYAWREIDSARQDLLPLATPRPALAAPPIASPLPLPSILPSAASTPAAPVRPMAVLVRATDQVWIYVEVDGKPYYGANGTFLGPGDEAGFVGTSVKIRSGRPAATLVSTDGRNYAAMSATSKEWHA